MDINIATIEDGLEQLANQKLDPVEYGFGLLPIFMTSKSQLSSIRTSKQNQSDIEGGYIWRQKLHYAPAEKGQCDGTLEKLKGSKLSRKHKARLLMTSDGETVLVFDAKYNEVTSSTVAGIKDEPQVFLPLIGQERSREMLESDIDIKATAKLARFYDALVEANPEWLSERRHDLNHFMTQMIFCLFAEDTGIFPKDILSKTLIDRSGPEGKYATDVIAEIFTSLDVADRSQYPQWLAQFPYVNGGLFSGGAAVPKITPKAYRYLKECWALDWKGVNPDILGSSIQAIVDEEMRGDLGMHYTSVPNILKVINPLFIDDLREQLWKSRNSKKKIQEFLERLSRIKVFDPACGSGNFLVIAYREMRKLELDAMDALRDLIGGASMAFGFSSVVSLSNFYGIEYADFAAETAKLALWIAEYQQNARFTAAFGESIPSLPLRDAGNIICANALHVNWEDVCPKSEGYEVYIVGNPPYLGSSNLNTEQKGDMTSVFKGRVDNYKTLDYVCAWFMKAADYYQGYDGGAFAFVATNSICQGSQVPILWPPLFAQGMEIRFAHTSFKWRNNAAHNAGVICVIVGMGGARDKVKTLFTDDVAYPVSTINGYLLPKPHVSVVKRSKPISKLPSMDYGNKPVDGGNLILSPQEKAELIESYPRANSLIKEFYGSVEFIRGYKRFCLWIPDEHISLAEDIPAIARRIDACKSMRLNSRDPGANKLADRPHQFRDFRSATFHTVIIPRVSSETRNFLPCGVLSSSAIVSDGAFALYDPPIWTISILASRLHLLWVQTVCGRLKTDYRYSNTLGWNTFPVPDLTDEQKDALDEGARNIILTRESHLGATIADLYDPEKMPDDLREAHRQNDALLESYYADKPFTDDEERLAHLFERYVEMTQN